MLSLLTDGGWSVSDIDLDRGRAPEGSVAVALTITGKGSVESLTPELGHLAGVVSVATSPAAVDL